MSKLEQLRKEKGIGQSAFAESLGIASSTYCQYEKGARMIPVSTRSARLSAVCESRGYFFTDEIHS